jgi:hypothetical protein
MDAGAKLSDIPSMWFRRQPNALARMPSMRPHALNPRQVTGPAAPAKTDSAAPKLAALATPAAQGAAALTTAPQSGPDLETPDEAAARAGGFHESSYELQHGLQISESEWPDDVTIPGALDAG